MQPLTVRVIDLETTGSHPPAHGVCEVGWQDVCLSADNRWVIGDNRGAQLVNPGRLIPPVTMAVHHILDSDVAEAPLWPNVAPRVLYPEDRVVALAAHSAAFEQRFCTSEYTKDLPWICTWKCALRVFPDAPRFSNQVLRYWRMPEGLDQALGLPVHRAFPDAYVTAHHLRDMLNIVSVEQLLNWSNEPGLLPRVPAGPFRGRAWVDLDVESLNRFAEDRNEDVSFSAQTELNKRNGKEVVHSELPKQGRLF